MEPQFQRSFIPKKPIVAAPVKAASSISLLSLLATIIFILAIALSGGVFLYRNLVQGQIDSDKISLDRAKGAFEPDLIAAIVRLDSRIKSAKGLLAGHVSVTPLFDLLSRTTLPDIRFRDFSFSYLSPTKVSVAMKGQASSYSTVALEADLLGSQKSLSDVVVGDLALDPDGTVSFSVAANIDPTLVSYASTIAGQSPVATVQASATTSASVAQTTASTSAQVK